MPGPGLGGGYACTERRKTGGSLRAQPSDWQVQTRRWREMTLNLQPPNKTITQTRQSPIRRSGYPPRPNPSCASTARLTHHDDEWK